MGMVSGWNNSCSLLMSKGKLKEKVVYLLALAILAYMLGFIY